MVPLGSIHGQLKEMFVSRNVLKLGFRFKQDLVFLSSTFCSHGCEPGFDGVEPFIDISSIYHLLQRRQLGKRISKNTKSLATICEELLGVTLSKELQCSDWSLRPLTEEQKAYAAMDAHCLLEIFSLFQVKLDKEGGSQNDIDVLQFSNLSLQSREVIEKSTVGKKIVSSSISEASKIVSSTPTAPLELFKNEPSLDVVVSESLCNQTINGSLSKIVCKYGSKLLLKESDRKPKASKKKGNKHKRRSESQNSKPKDGEWVDDWQSLVPWELSNGGDGCPKFLCDVMIEGLAKRLRCVGIDAAVPFSKKPESRELIQQARKEKRVLLTRDAKLLRHEYLIENQIYRVNSLNKDEQLKEVIETFQLKISEDQLMSRCCKCNGRFIQKPLTIEEAIEAAKGFQKIPNCLFKKDLEFWQCMDCKRLYWEGTQYRNAMQNLSTFITCE